MADAANLAEGEREYIAYAGTSFIRDYLKRKGVRESVTWFELEGMLADAWIEAWLAAKIDDGMIHISH